MRRISKEFLRSRFFAAERFLLYYERHDCPKLNRLHLVTRGELIPFLENCVRPERSQGADLTITTFEMAEFVITSHDGEMWFRRPTEWPTRANA